MLRRVLEFLLKSVQSVIKKLVMKFLGIIGLISAVNAAAYVPLFRTPSLDTAVVHSAQYNGGFAYNTIENHAYVPPVSLFCDLFRK